MKPPIIVDEHGDIMFFESKKSAEDYHEAIDVRNEEYVANDSRGVPLYFEIIKARPRCLLWRWCGNVEYVVIKEGLPTPECTSDLTERLRAYFKNRFPEMETSTMSLESLVTLGEKHCT